jgi:hypothetical protein
MTILRKSFFKNHEPSVAKKKMLLKENRGKPTGELKMVENVNLGITTEWVM